MVDEKIFRERMQEVARLISRLDEISDQPAQASARKLVQLVMELHGDALDRTMEIIAAQGVKGEEILHKLGSDPVISSLLVVHGLHPDDLPVRIQRAVEQVAARLRKQDIALELITADAGSVHLQARLNGHTCGSTAATIRAEIEEAIAAAAPEIESLVIEGLEPKAADSFVPIERLANAPAISPLVESEAGD